jgi:G3E family GTPase
MRVGHLSAVFWSYQTGASAAVQSISVQIARTDLVAAIEYIIANTEVRKIMVETNGVADPVQSIKQFWFDEEALIHAQLHSVISVVSARRWAEDSVKPLFERQVAAANRVVVSFVDQVGEETYGEVVEGIRKLNFECTISR